MAEVIDVSALKTALREFAKAREWEPFHNPKNLAMALAAESGELLEIFQWLTMEESAAIQFEDKTKTAVAYELADIFLYSLLLADTLQINLARAIDDKLQINAKKYPVEKAKGHAKKYDKI